MIIASKDNSPVMAGVFIGFDLKGTIAVLHQRLLVPLPEKRNESLAPQ
jgi:hypothetical protein